MATQYDSERFFEGYLSEFCISLASKNINLRPLVSHLLMFPHQLMFSR